MLQKIISIFIFLSLCLGYGIVKASNAIDLKSQFNLIEELTGAKGQYFEKENVFKVALPRADLNVAAAGVKLNPAMGLTIWAAFQFSQDGTMVMGDLVLTQDQVNSVIDTALENGLEVTALHNHFLWESPRIMFMHISGMGKTEDLARAVGRVFRKIGSIEAGNRAASFAEIDPKNSTFDPAIIEKIIGIKGQLSGGVYKIVSARETVMHGKPVGNAMGVNTWAAFAGSNERAVIDGDFAMMESELQPVLKALRKADINIVAIHNHMVMESPRVIFLHYWGIGPVEKLANGIKSALETQQK